MKTMSIYAAGPWFTEEQERVQTNIENYLLAKEGVSVYRPRHDGVKLGANEFHNSELRKKVFMDNINHIDSADFIVANLDGRDGFQDTGTCYEVGYAMARGIPVIGYQDDKEGKLNEHMKSVSDEFVAVCTGLDELDAAINTMVPMTELIQYTYSRGSKILYIAPDNTTENIEKASEVANVLVECYGTSFRWIDKPSEVPVAKYINETFQDIDFMVAVIDDRNPIVSWMMGQCFARNVPIVSYTNYDYGVNIMLLCSIVSHVKGTDKLKEVTQVIKRSGIESLENFDSSNIKAF